MGSRGDSVLSLAWEPLFCPAISPGPEKLDLEGARSRGTAEMFGESWAAGRTEWGDAQSGDFFFSPLRRGAQSKVAELVGRGADPHAPSQEQEVMV